MVYLSLASLVVLLLLPACDAAATCYQSDQDSLLSFSSNITVSCLPFNWSSSSDCCDWEGVERDASDSRVTRLWLPSRGLNGYFSPSLANLTRISYFNLSYNRLNGPLPDGFFSSLTSLRVLDLNLTGVIPQDIGKLYNLEYLLLIINNLTGHLPPSLSNCTNLVVMNLWVNSLLGQLSALNFSSFVKLTTIDLGNNNFKVTFTQTGLVI